jgi:2'-5' RNA ligase
MRCFIAIDISDDIKKSIAKVIENLGYKIKGIKWVDPQNIHLTLKFLGEIDDKKINLINERLSILSKRHSVFDVSISNVGGFPNLKNPKVLWVGINDSEKLTNLYNELENALFEIGFGKENRKFSPHLTIARIKDKRDADLILRHIMEYKNYFFGEMKVCEIVLMKSTLKPSGAEYTKLNVFKLLDKKN